jgi:hypothetical protein
MTLKTYEKELVIAFGVLAPMQLYLLQAMQ